jgi:hypothetical protein
MTQRLLKPIADQRGFIMLLGIVMGALLVGMLWYMVGVGDAIIQRERMQDAADAVAFESAVWHARGMNLHAFMNIMMAVLFTIMVMVRAAELLILGIMAGCHLAALATGPGNLITQPGCLVLDRALLQPLKTLVQQELRHAPKLINIEQKISDYQVKLAAIVPYVAAGDGIDKTVSFYESQGVIAKSNVIGASFFPTSMEVPLTAVGVHRRLAGPLERYNTLYGVGGAALQLGSIAWTKQHTSALAFPLGSGGLPSLPVERGNFAQLCSRTNEYLFSRAQDMSIANLAIEFIGPQVLPGQVMSRLDAGDEAVRTIFGNVFYNEVAATIFCEPLISIFNRVVSGAIDQAGIGFGTQKLLKKAQPFKWLIKKLNEFMEGKDPLLERDPSLDPDAPNISDEERQARRETRDKHPDAPGISDEERSRRRSAIADRNWKSDWLGASMALANPSRMWNVAHNGNVFTQLWSTVEAPKESRFFGSDKPTGTLEATAEAEFFSMCYYLVEDRQSDALAKTVLEDIVLRDCEDDAMWRLGWTARMRRVRPALELLSPSEVAGDLLRQTVGDYLAHQSSQSALIPNVDRGYAMGRVMDWIFTGDDSPVTKALDRLFAPLESDGRGHPNIIH